jgi:chromosome segregation ATPase
VSAHEQEADMTLAMAQTLDLRDTVEPDPYLEVARRFFNEFIELKLELDRNGAVTAEVQKKERARYEKELKKWQEANEALKSAAAAFAKDNERLEAELAASLAQVDDLKRQINELHMRNNETARKLRSYPLDQHMSEAAFKEWQKILTEIPSLRG